MESFVRTVTGFAKINNQQRGLGRLDDEQNFFLLMFW